MSFSSEVKNELTGVMPEARHCKIAEIAAVYAILGDHGNAEGLTIRTENERLARKFFTLREINNYTWLKNRGRKGQGKIL